MNRVKMILLTLLLVLISIGVTSGAVETRKYDVDGFSIRVAPVARVFNTE